MAATCTEPGQTIHLWTPTHKRVLEAQKVEDVAYGRVCSCGCVTIAGVRLAVDKAVLEAQEVEEVEDTVAVAVGVAIVADEVRHFYGDAIDLESTETVAESVCRIKEELDADILTGVLGEVDLTRVPGVGGIRFIDQFAVDEHVGQVERRVALTLVVVAVGERCSARWIEVRHRDER